MFDVRNVGIDHESDQVEDKVSTLAQNSECCEAEVLEARIVNRLYTTHGIQHLLAYFDGWCERLGISPKDVSEINYNTTSYGTGETHSDNKSNAP